MRDKSQIDDMRAALRGDLERARERRGATLLDRAPESEAQEPETPEAEPVLQAEVPDTPIEASEPQPVSGAQQPPEIQEPEPKRRRFLWFLND